MPRALDTQSLPALDSGMIVGVKLWLTSLKENQETGSCCWLLCCPINVKCREGFILKLGADADIKVNRIHPMPIWSLMDVH